MTSDLRNQIRMHIYEVVQLTYFMNGAISYSEMMEMSLAEKQIVSDFIKQLMESKK
jgi:hypothetical protein